METIDAILTRKSVRNFAKKEVEEEIFCDTTKCWQEKTIETPKLLVQYL